jgi:hypothetical protein
MPEMETGLPGHSKSLEEPVGLLRRSNWPAGLVWGFCSLRRSRMGRERKGSDEQK